MVSIFKNVNMIGYNYQVNDQVMLWDKQDNKYKAFFEVLYKINQVYINGTIILKI